MTYFARSERIGLCDLALAMGESEPTLCGGWSVKELVVHLLVRERSPLGSPGIVVPALAGVTNRVSARLSRVGFPALVERLRTPRLTLSAIPAVDGLVNSAEFFVHHEDIRRARSGWVPRDLGVDAQSVLWRIARTMGRGPVRPVGVPVTVERVDTGQRAVLRTGAGGVVVHGLPSEIVLFLFGRSEVTGLNFDGPEAAIDSLTSAALGL